MDIKRLVGMNIRAARKAKGLTQFQLAERSGLSADFIGNVERGMTSPSIESLKRIADALNLSLPDIFTGEVGAGPQKEALVELIRICREHENEEIALIVGIAQLIFERMKAGSKKQ